jgi:hypothetical protein
LGDWHKDEAVDSSDLDNEDGDFTIPFNKTFWQT